MAVQLQARLAGPAIPGFLRHVISPPPVPSAFSLQWALRKFPEGPCQGDGQAGLKQTQIVRCLVRLERRSRVCIDIRGSLQTFGS
eukprot:3499274-Pyramimonas_sp.AAC.1